MRRRRVLVMPLGERERQPTALLAERFPDAEMECVDRAAFRTRLLVSLLQLARHRYDDAIVLAPSLRQPRLRLTSMVLLAALRAHRLWLADDGGGIEPLTRVGLLRGNGAGAARHLAACMAALIVAGPLLTVAAVALDLERRLGLRHLPPRKARRILYLRSQLWFGLKGGGSVAHVAGVTGGLAQAGVEVRAVASDRLYGAEVPTRVVRTERWFDGWLKEAEELAYNWRFTSAAIHELRTLRPDAIYQRYEAFNFTGALLSRVFGVPLVLEFNSSEVWKGRHWGGVRLLRLAELGERVNLRAADRIVVVSRTLRDQLVKAGVAETKLLVNPNGVDPHRFHPDVDATPVRRQHPQLGGRGVMVVGFSGTFGVWHGIPTLAEAIPLVARRVPATRFLLVGDGPLLTLVKERIAAHGLDHRVALAGLVPHDRMPAYLAACDILVSPHGRQADGREFFGSPTKLYEYMAAGRAIVASAVGQIAEVLQDGETALLVPPDDPEALADAIARLVDDAGLRSRLGRAARARAASEHTWLRNAERVLASLATADAMLDASS